jgi:hypothetical protein
MSDIADDVMNGKYGDGEERKRRLENEGYNYAFVQNEVNRRLGYPKRHNPFDYYPFS